MSFGLAVLGGFLLYEEGSRDPVPPELLGFDFSAAMALCLTLWFRRRWPVQLAVIAAAVSTFSDMAGAAALLLIITVAIYRPWRTTALIFVLNAISSVTYVRRIRQKPESLLEIGLWAVLLYSAVAGWASACGLAGSSCRR